MSHTSICKTIMSLYGNRTTHMQFDFRGGAASLDIDICVFGVNSEIIFLI